MSANSRADHKIPPRKGKEIVLTVTTTSRTYDIGKLVEGKAPVAKRLRYIQLQAESADCYYLFSSSSSCTVDETAVVAESAVPTFVANACDRIKQDTEQPFDWDSLQDRYLTIKGSGAGKLRIHMSSEAHDGSGEPTKVSGRNTGRKRSR